MVLTALQGGPGAVRAEFRDLRYALRQANSSWLESRRAVANSSRGPEKLSSTIRQLFCGRPSTAATPVRNFKATDAASVSKVIHTDNQLQAGQFDNGGLPRMNTKERAIKLIHEGPPSSTFLRDNSTWR